MLNRLPALLALTLVLLLPAPLPASSLDRPAGLEPDIQFWRQVFTEITTREGFVHDDRRLDIIYETVRLPEQHTHEDRRRLASAAAKRYAEMLSSLAGGKRTGLSADERRILELWGNDVDNHTLAAAAGRVRFQLGQADRFKEGLARSGLWADQIERTLAAAGLPRELIALPHVESAFNPMARSHAGAAGLWQFMPGTGRRFLTVDTILDERLDPYRATEAAALLLAHNYAVTGTWPTAITAYNHGAAGMQRAIRQLGTDDIETLVREYRGRAFGFASRNFYVSFLAAADVRDDAERYFGDVPRLNPDDSQVLILPGYAPVVELAEQLGVDIDTLSRLNPAFRRPIWDGTKHVPKGYALRLPAEVGRRPEQWLAAIPADLWQQRQVPDVYHVVQRGETLSTIAPRYGASINEIVGLNGLANAHRIRAGQRLVLPGAVVAREMESEAAVDDGVYPDQAATVAAADPAQPAADIASAAPATPTPAEPIASGLAIELPMLAGDPNDYSVAANRTIKVFEGESLGHYAHWLNLPTSALRSHNGLSGDAVIRVGSSVKLDFSRTTPQEFERRRVSYHRDLQEQFFSLHRIAGTKEHVIRRGESVWVLAGRQYGVPVWLLRQYNPELDLTMVRPGTRVVIPQLEYKETQQGPSIDV